MPSPDYLAYHPNPKKPGVKLPAESCDAHCHVFGPAAQFPFAASSTYEPVDASKDSLFALHRHLGIERSVIVQASCHGTDNSAMVDALLAGGDSYRGVAVVSPDITISELQAMHEAGVRGVRFNFVKRLGGKKPGDSQQTIMRKIKSLGWHVVVYFDSDDIDELAPFLQQIELPVVIDHMGRVPVEQGVDSHAFGLLSSLLKDDKYWVKISCPERLSKQGPPYTDVDEVAKALLSQVPERVLWGTDWPHPNMKSHMPDDGQLVDRIVGICQNEVMLQQVLVTNPAALYWS